ncbi:N-acetyl-L,L-diaminopimelate deacetylase [Indibacter alkaliphilus LW1]|uniref:N-acetyl-L,L-diaminopimelate deacetylase n=1 Tax=Indibacter alkaliphilus (strain CCUG 57479 / KCTC 22604 / LW1) TaxID=1189612 RepID=S2DP87_INDAL|nr:amidohydrolase [Indibacter alkaliphilus]EOZ99005.1 N-acetyl-L,L-diaminopimelate deacetylase [Indibacter alkaliphilus LW1]
MKKSKYTFLILLFSIAFSGFIQAQQLDASIDKMYPELDALYKELHQNPELSLQEKETSARIAEELRDLGYEVTEGIGGYGVVGIMKNGPGPVLLIRADMDALPMEEKTGLPYASTKKGVTNDGKETFIAHSCGHDIHMTVFIGTARLMQEFKDSWRGTLLMVGQPSEENGMGAWNMFNDGLYEKFPHPDFAIALHDDPFLPAGKVGYKAGPLMAGVDMMNVTVFGEGAHGAAPHTGIDPIVLSAQMIQAYQTIVSRRIAPTDPAVVTVGSIRGGSVHNIIPDEVTMQLTLRSYSPEVREEMISSIKRISDQFAKAAGLSDSKMPEYWIREPHTPALVNDEALTERMVEVFRANLGEENVKEVKAQMIGEDFSRFGLQARNIPISMFYLGATDPDFLEKAQAEGLEIPGLHSPQFAPLPEPTIKTGVKAMGVFAMEILRNMEIMKK